MNIRAETHGATRRVSIAASFVTLLFTALMLMFAAGADADADVSASLERQAGRFGTVQVIVTIEAAPATRAVIFDEDRWDERSAELRKGLDSVIDDVGGDEADIVRRFEGLPQAVVEVTLEGLAELAEHPEVTAINAITLDSPSLHLSTQQIQSKALNALGYTGSTYRVAVIDTGVLSGHQFLTGKVLPGSCFTNNSGQGTSGAGGANGCPNGTGVQHGGSAGEPCAYAGNACRHGTHVAGIVAGGPINDLPAAGDVLTGVAPGSNVIPYQVFTEFNAASTCGASIPCVRSYSSDQMAALQNVLQRVQGGEKIAAVNMSLGGGEETAGCPGDSRAPVVNQLRSAGVAVVIASGNEGSSTYINAPGCIPSAITVGSVSKSSPGTSISSFSNHTHLVDLLAPGGGGSPSGIASSVTTSSTTYNYLSGTSMATPHVAGAWAAIKQRHPAASVSLIEDALKATGPMTSRGCATVPVVRLVDAAAWIDSNPGGSAPPTDTTAPAVAAAFVPASPGAGGAYTTGTATLNLTASDAGAGVRCIEWREGSNGTINQQTGSTFSYVATNGEAAAQQYNIQYRAIDWAGNAGSYQSVTFSVRDGVAPTTTHTLSPTNPNGANGWYTGSPPQVTLAATDNFAPTNQLAITYRLGTTGEFVPYTAPFAVPANSPNVVVQYRATDPAGNVETTRQFTVKTDSVAPSTTSQLSATQVTHPATIQVTLAATDATAGIATTAYCITTSASCTPATPYTGPFNLSGIGNFTVAYRSTDAAGNVEPNRTATARIADPTPPVSSHQVTPGMPDGTGGWYHTTPQVTLSSTDNITPANELQIEYRVGGSGAFIPYTGPFGVAGQGEAIAVEYRATDGDGNVETPKLVELDIDSVAPVTTATAEPPQIPFPGTILVTLTAADSVSGPAGTVYCVTLNTNCSPSTPYTEPFAIWGMGIHTVRFRSTDAAGNLEAVKQTMLEIEVVPLTVAFGDLPSQLTYGEEFTASALVLGGTPAEITAAGACVVSGDTTSPVTVHVVAAGECLLTADGIGVVGAEHAAIAAAKAPTSTKLTVKPRKVRAGKKAKLRAVVHVPGGRAAEGRVEFRVRGKRVTVQVNASGVAVAKVKLTGRPGRKLVVKARHLGNGNLVASPMAKTKVALR